jgi:hypothetical protein
MTSRWKRFSRLTPEAEEFQPVVQKCTASLAVVRKCKLALWKHRKEHGC